MCFHAAKPTYCAYSSSSPPQQPLNHQTARSTSNFKTTDCWRWRNDHRPWPYAHVRTLAATRLTDLATVKPAHLTKAKTLRVLLGFSPSSPSPTLSLNSQWPRYEKCVRNAPTHPPANTYFWHIKEEEVFEMFYFFFGVRFSSVRLESYVFYVREVVRRSSPLHALLSSPPLNLCAFCFNRFLV